MQQQHALTCSVMQHGVALAVTSRQVSARIQQQLHHVLAVEPNSHTQRADAALILQSAQEQVTGAGRGRNWTMLGLVGCGWWMQQHTSCACAVLMLGKGKMGSAPHTTPQPCQAVSPVYSLCGPCVGPGVASRHTTLHTTPLQPGTGQLTCWLTSAPPRIRSWAASTLPHLAASWRVAREGWGCKANRRVVHQRVSGTNWNRVALFMLLQCLD